MKLIHADVVEDLTLARNTMRKLHFRCVHLDKGQETWTHTSGHLRVEVSIFAARQASVIHAYYGNADKPFFTSRSFLITRIMAYMDKILRAFDRLDPGLSQIQNLAHVLDSQMTAQVEAAILTITHDHLKNSISSVSKFRSIGGKKSVEKTATLNQERDYGTLLMRLKKRRDPRNLESRSSAPEKYSHISFKPPSGVADAARKGLDYRKKVGRGGTEVGVARARDLSGGGNISPSTARRMNSYFARHSVDKNGDGWGSTSEPSAGYVAWLLWGGDAGQSWASKLCKQMDAADAE
jgi:hypothetical protein